MPRHRRRNDWPPTVAIMLAGAILAGLLVLLLRHQLGIADRALDTGARPVEATREITYTGPITSGPTPTPPPGR
jgi:hypothetical protein